jgi:hypothetical protein
MAFFNQQPAIPRDPVSIQRHAWRRGDFIPPGWVLLVVFATVAGLFYLAVATRFADTTVVVTGAARPTSPPIVIGEETRPTQASIR